MDLRIAFLPCLFLAAGLAGCAGDHGESKDVGVEISVDHGSVLGLVTDDEAQPLGDVSIGLRTVKLSPIEITVLTNEGGRFRLDNVPAGKQTVVAQKGGYGEAITTITIVPGVETPVRLILVPLPVREFRIEPLTAIKGHYDCAVEYVLASGECDYEVYNHTGLRPLQTRNNNSLAIPSDWGGILFEIAWRYGVEPSTVEGIRFQLESEEDVGGMFLKVDGTKSPMRVAINAGQVAPDATLGYPIPQRGVRTWIHVLPLGMFDGASCPVQCGYGVGLAINLEYDVYVTYFFGGSVEPDYTTFTG